MSAQEDALWDLSDEDLEAAFKEAKAQEASPETEVEDTIIEDSTSDIEEDEQIELTLDEESEVEDEEINDGPEHLEDEDSGHDTSAEAETDEAEAEDSSETEDEVLEQDSETEEEPSSDEAEDEKVDEQPVPYKFRANGKDYEFSSEEIVDQFPKIFGQAMDYTKKMQTIKPWRKTIDAIEGAQLNHDDISLMIDVLKGDKNAITEVLKRTGVDTLELDTEEDSKYVAKDYGRNDSALAIKDIVDDISRDVEYATTHNIIDKDWDDKSWAAMTEKPETIRLLHADVKSGMYSTIQPLAEKLKVYDAGSKSDLEYYVEAAKQHFAKIKQDESFAAQRTAKQDAKTAQLETEKARLAEVKIKTAQRTATKQASTKRKAAAPTKNIVATPDVVDYLNDSDENFDEWYKELQDKM